MKKVLGIVWAMAALVAGMDVRAKSNAEGVRQKLRSAVGVAQSGIGKASAARFNRWSCKDPLTALDGLYARGFQEENVKHCRSAAPGQGDKNVLKTEIEKVWEAEINKRTEDLKAYYALLPAYRKESDKYALDIARWNQEKALHKADPHHALPQKPTPPSRPKCPQISKQLSRYRKAAQSGAICKVFPDLAGSFFQQLEGLKALKPKS